MKTDITFQKWQRWFDNISSVLSTHIPPPPGGEAGEAEIKKSEKTNVEGAYWLVSITSSTHLPINL